MILNSRIDRKDIFFHYLFLSFLTYQAFKRSFSLRCTVIGNLKFKIYPTLPIVHDKSGTYCLKTSNRHNKNRISITSTPFSYIISFDFIYQYYQNIQLQCKTSWVKDIQIILRLFLVIPMYCQASSSQIKSITQPLAVLASWERSLGTYSRQQFTRNNLYTI